MTSSAVTRVALLTREYPPDVYGGAGVHVEYLARELASRVDLTVHAWGTPDTTNAAAAGATAQPQSEFGDGWYHEAAVKEADQSRKR